eukprot:GHRR01005396.1.p1 GENE.GHRR01005396.1~~GHRR01005396.1.p1  ORF type:complete len:264 (+),score=92.96 GHRR01005396.1:180-971(+)
MPLIYSAVGRGPVLLAEYAVFAGNFSSVTKDYLSKSINAGRFSYTVDNHVFSFLAEDGYCYVVVTDEGAGRTIPNSFLDKVKEEFTLKYSEKGKTVKELGLSNFGRRLKEMMEHATQFPEEYSKVSSVQKKVDEVKGIMSDNIEKVLSRGEKLDLLVDKTDNLMFEADRFVKSGRALRRKMWWNNIKMKIVMGVAVVMVILIIFLLICFGGGRSCIKKRHSAANLAPAPAVPANGTAAAPTASSSGAHKRLLLEVLQILPLAA